MFDLDKNTDKNTSQAKDKKKARLGRGLGSLLGDDTSASTSEPSTLEPRKRGLQSSVAQKQEAKSETKKEIKPDPVSEQNRIWTVAIDKVFPNKEQPRKDFVQDKIQELSQSIKEQGIIQPITVRKTPEGYEIIAGERRWRAAQHAGLHEVPVIIKEADNKKVMEWALIENIQREDLNPIEEAEAYNNLLQEYKYTHQQLAERVGKDRTTISNALRILVLPKEVRELVRAGKLSTGHAKVLSGLDNPEKLKQLARKIVNKSLSVRATEKEVAALKNPATSQTTPNMVAIRQVEALSSELQKTLGTRVKIDYTNGKGKLSIQFYNDEELSKIADKLKAN